MSKNKTSAKVAIIMGSDSDYPIMKEAEAALNELNVSVQVDIVSAHRTPEKLASFATNAREQGITVIIAGAGGAAHLPGMVAAYTTLPVIGVPVPATLMNGLDSLYSIVQMPKGVPWAWAHEIFERQRQREHIEKRVQAIATSDLHRR